MKRISSSFCILFSVVLVLALSVSICKPIDAFSTSGLPQYAGAMSGSLMGQAAGRDALQTNAATEDCKNKNTIEECPICDAACCARARPCSVPVGCKPGDCSAAFR
ncbi:hypothetical protein MPTK1_3g10180 [Marchantia polymorpha subsp. ruderalis]|uniref:Uncharacterized protein n=2 Tax=Marchantia polymorpha TaxID=3197 RepID=A0A176WQW7_MARPO|nr:hypothetical protein AXG93_2189s1410 [Marchantia polymorpha subsp. ruderalis]PTQ33785.1 hypothetical protein MARPO_0085s0009 [Marchantia polymorpha]PTQ33786.1 hypothetical protein MARPO_0085s0009 [Marchantia polymorpha]BBN05087.1 hypothetical protein Mp_3g10180 [Marchantia polymorpha subsp. ruderalis]BBN05088.1 hypothetical protein Mp_3g10180 [Marchantia polymorpha subsp. ruderalis]|eukprot:PTQ33785.1 hypothetical protein MARPO_0085s0009 [Marchantia polymorpha]